MSNKEQLLSSQLSRPKPKPTQFTQVLRFFNIVLSIAIIGFSIYSYVGLQIEQNLNVFDNPSVIVLPAYVALSGLIILCVECNVKFIVRNMKFLFHYFGRGIFNVYVGILCFAILRPQSTPAYKTIVYVAGGLMTIFGLFYIIAVVFCCARASKDYEEEEEKSSTRGNRSSDVIINTSRRSIND